MEKKKDDKSDLKKIDELLLKYNVKEKIDENSLKIKKVKSENFEDLSEIAKNEEKDISEVKSVDYNIIKDDLSRLESYKELMKNYKLNEEQVNAVSEIYNRTKENESRLNEDSSYKAITETVKELSNLSKRIINEISGNYLKSIDEYKKAP